MALNLSCESVGSGPPLVVLHGLFGSSGNWRGVARELAATHAVHCVDLRNHGASPWADSMDYGEMADDVLQLIERLGLDRPAVLGHSMGGKTAMALALRHPKRVGRLIVVDIAPVSYVDTLTPFAEAMRSVDVVAAVSRTEVQRRLQECVPDGGVVPFLMQNLVTRNDHFDWRVNVAAIAASAAALSGFPDQLRDLRFARPAQLLKGEFSDYVGEADLPHFQPMFPALQVETIASAGHWVHADQPDAVVEALLRFLAPATKVAAG